MHYQQIRENVHTAGVERGVKMGVSIAVSLPVKRRACVCRRDFRAEP